MKIITLLFILFLWVPCFAQDKVYTEEDLGKYKKEVPTQSIKSSNNREKYDLLGKYQEILVNDNLTEYQRCRQLDEIISQLDGLREKGEFADIKFRHRKICPK